MIRRANSSSAEEAKQQSTTQQRTSSFSLSNQLIAAGAANLASTSTAVINRVALTGGEATGIPQASNFTASLVNAQRQLVPGNSLRNQANSSITAQVREQQLGQAALSNL
jgi:hypothetical protein